ncbi:AraC family transcriptional regulator [Alcanivorax sp. 1008]|uniref:helix-turn-helix transcriptional regulator n=1 Tax=Alcanivorax sp. 1008 TaxID=2816853 RepID=UPI001DCC3845|nr:AraC family transcriptional regulator [Alcanivorax sp. 1008]MCC1498297.1 helix-turn-helix domain-containing protein [Alcanivorax sp. 1008]
MTRSVHGNVVMNNLAALRQYLLRHDLMDKLPAILAAIEVAPPSANGRICLESNSRNIRRVAEILGDPCLGLELIASLADSNLALLDTIDAQLGAGHQPMRQHPLMVIRLLERYMHIHSEVADLHCQVTRDHYRLTVEPFSEIVSHHQTDGVLITVHRAFIRLVKEKPVALRLTQSGNEETGRRYQEHFGVTPEFESPHNELVYKNTSRAVAEVSDYLATVTSNEQALFEQFPQLSFSERCRGAIRLLLTLGEPRREHLCHIFSTSLPTLKRRLQAEGTSYAALVRDVRMVLAVHYARDDALSVTETALLLGYQDVHQYSRAFKNWFGHAPTEHAESV